MEVGVVSTGCVHSRRQTWCPFLLSFLFFPVSFLFFSLPYFAPFWPLRFLFSYSSQHSSFLFPFLLSSSLFPLSSFLFSFSYSYSYSLFFSLFVPLQNLCYPVSLYPHYCFISFISYISALRVADHAKKRAKELSGGTKRKVMAMTFYFCSLVALCHALPCPTSLRCFTFSISILYALCLCLCLFVCLFVSVCIYSRLRSSSLCRFCSCLFVFVRVYSCSCLFLFVPVFSQFIRVYSCLFVFVFLSVFV